MAWSCISPSAVALVGNRNHSPQRCRFSRQRLVRSKRVVTRDWGEGDGNVCASQHAHHQVWSGSTTCECGGIARQSSDGPNVARWSRADAEEFKLSSSNPTNESKCVPVIPSDSTLLRLIPGSWGHANRTVNSAVLSRRRQRDNL